MIWHTHLWHLYPGWLHPICGDGDFTAHLHPSFDGLYNQCKDSGGQSTCLFDQPDSRHPANHQCTRLSSTSRCCYQRGETINFFLIQIIKSWLCCVMSVVLYTAYCCGHMLFIWIMYVPNRWKMEMLHSNNIKNCSELFVFLHQHMCTVEVCNSFNCVVFLVSMMFISRAAPNPVKTSIRHSSLSHCFCFFGVYGHLLIHSSLKVPPQHFRQPGQSRLDWAKATPWFFSFSAVLGVTVLTWSSMDWSLRGGGLFQTCCHALC